MLFTQTLHFVPCCLFRITGRRVFVLVVLACLLSVSLPQTTKAQTSVAATQAGLKIDMPDSVPGGQPFLIQISAPGLQEVTLTFNDKTLFVPVTTMPNAGDPSALAMLGTSFDAQTATLPLRLEAKINEQKILVPLQIKVSKKNYPTQELTVDSKFVDLSKADLERHSSERAKVNAIIAQVNPARYWHPPFARPVPGEVSSAFGLTRLFNGKPRSSHKGLDLRAAEGDPVKACADGVVALSDNHFFSGNVIYIDHGLGLVTAYAHLSERLVKQGDRVKAGEVIGKIGSTGRVTGPHLHLSALVLGTSIDPEALIGLNLSKNINVAPAQNLKGDNLASEPLASEPLNGQSAVTLPVKPKTVSNVRPGSCPITSGSAKIENGKWVVVDKSVPAN